MNSLEFIEKQIKAVEKELAEIVDITNDYFEIPDTYENKYNLIDDANERYSNYKLRLSELYQIKFQLEAWKVVKNKGVDMLIFMLYHNNLEEYNNYIKSLEGECNYEKCLLTQNEADTIKKALEV